MIPLLVLLALVVAGVVVWRMRVRIAAKVLGQSEERMHRTLNRKR